MVNLESFSSSLIDQRVSCGWFFPWFGSWVSMVPSPSRVIFLDTNYYWVAVTTDIAQSIMYVHALCVYVPPAYSHAQQNVHNFITHPFRVGVCSGGITCPQPGSSLHTSQRNEVQDVVTCLKEVRSGPLKSCGGGEWQTTSVLVVEVLNPWVLYSPCLRVVCTHSLCHYRVDQVQCTWHTPSSMYWHDVTWSCLYRGRRTW